MLSPFAKTFNKAFLDDILFKYQQMNVWALEKYFTKKLAVMQTAHYYLISESL